jgi:hypothetical protein
MSRGLPRGAGVRRYGARVSWVHEATRAWRSGTQRSQLAVLLTLLAAVALWFAVSQLRYEYFPLAGYFLWLLLGMLLLRFAPLFLLTAAIVAAAIADRFSDQGTNPAPAAAVVVLVMSVALVLYVASRQRSGLPTPLSEALLSDLRDRLTAQGQVPPLPDGWHAQSAMVAAYGVGYAGDFMVADLDEDEQRLELVLVDVVGKGVTAAPSALLLAGALGGLIGAMHDRDLFDAANDFLLRQQADETFATAVHLSLHLDDGSYTILSAGHPPALRWSGREQVWSIDNSRGLALGIQADPELNASHGTMEPGDALMFYTDGVVESPTSDLDTGIAWLQDVARTAMLAGVDGAAGRVIARVARGDDDRAVLIISRR